MSKKKKPFDAVREFEKRWCRDCHWIVQWAMTECPEQCGQDGRGIRAVLEVAGKMDKQYCIEVFEMFVKNTALGPYDDIRYRKDGLAIFPVSQLRALLEALPEKEEK